MTIGHIAEDIYDFIRGQLATSVPFAAHAGVELTDVGDGAAVAQLAQTEHSVNHIGSQHAGALFTLAEAASGAAMIGALADRVLEVRPLVRAAQVEYLRVAHGTITAHAETEATGPDLRAQLDLDGRADTTVGVTMRDADGHDVARMRVEWAIKGRKPATAPTA